jgi:3-hydroxyacyl-CoA dehydrogenase/3a,7a,12a-trihydroxy-5b-cholest-24-enoyl-CoA hydratase
MRGAGGWGGDRGPSGVVNVPPERAPDAVREQKVGDSQALLYRLSGDWNPLHVDPGFAKAFGFERPILHGLCTYGYAARHVVEAFAGGDTRLFKSIQVRFAKSVFPGETLTTEMWQEATGAIVFRCRVGDRDVITHARVELYDEIPTAPQPQAEAAAVVEEAAAPVGPTSEGAFLGMAVYVENHPELVGRVGKVFQFTLTDPGSQWSLDLANAPGSVTRGPADKPDCTLTLSDADFMAMSSGEADPMKLYMGGRLTIDGDLMASQKLDFLQKIDAQEVAGEVARRSADAPKAAPAAPQSTRAAAAPGVFGSLAARLAGDPELASTLEAIQFVISDPDGRYAVAGGTVQQGMTDEPAAVFTLSDQDLEALAGGASAQDFFQRGKLRIDGDVRLARQLGILAGLQQETNNA